MQLYIFRRYLIPESGSYFISVLGMLSGPGDEFFVNCSVDISSFKNIGAFMVVVCWSICMLLLGIIAVCRVFVTGVGFWMVLEFFWKVFASSSAISFGSVAYLLSPRSRNWIVELYVLPFMFLIFSILRPLGFGWL